MLKTNVKKMILTVMLIVDIIILMYANVDISRLYGDGKSKTMALLLGAKNVEHKNESTKKSESIKKDSLKQQTVSDQNAGQLKKTYEVTKTSQENRPQTNSNEAQGNTQISRGSNLGYNIDIVLTFYTSLAEENGGYRGINCMGQKLIPGMVANNVLPLGTEIYTSEFGTLTVSDRGGNNFNTIHRLDVYIPRNNGESDSDYLKRVNDMGKVKVNGYIIKQ